MYKNRPTASHRKHRITVVFTCHSRIVSSQCGIFFVPPFWYLKFGSSFQSFGKFVYRCCKHCKIIDLSVMNWSLYQNILSVHSHENISAVCTGQITCNFMKICQEMPNLVKIGQNYWAFYKKT